MTYTSVEKINVKKGEQGYTSVTQFTGERRQHLVERFDGYNLFEIREACIADSIVREVCHSSVAKPRNERDKRDADNKSRTPSVVVGTRGSSEFTYTAKILANAHARVSLTCMQVRLA